MCTSSDSDGKRPVPRKTAASRRLLQHRLGFDVRTVVTGRAFIALESPVGAVDRISDIHFATPIWPWIMQLWKEMSLFELSVTISSTQTPEGPGET